MLTAQLIEQQSFFSNWSFSYDITSNMDIVTLKFIFILFLQQITIV